MKRILFILSAVVMTSCANRLGDLTLLSNRNYDKSQDYVLLKQDVQVKVKTKKDDVIERAVDKATASVPGGEHLQNVTLWVSPSGKKLKLKGDVYGVRQAELPQANTATEWKVGDKVQYKTMTGRKTGTIIDISNSEEATIKLDESGNSETVPYKKLMKN